MEPTSILIIGGMIAGVLLILGLVVSIREEGSLVDERLEYLEDVRGVEAGSKAPVTDWLNEQAGRFTWGQRLARSLAALISSSKLASLLFLWLG